MIMGKTIAQVQIGKVVPLSQKVSSVGIDIEERGRRNEEGEYLGGSMPILKFPLLVIEFI